MEPTSPASILAAASGVCPVCHQSVLPAYYFCPNCGTELHAAPLSTSVGTQIGLYAFSIILPLMCFLFVTRWKGIKYLRSEDEKAKTIGMIAVGLLILSTVVTGYYLYVWTQSAIQSSINSINVDMGGY